MARRAKKAATKRATRKSVAKRPSGKKASGEKASSKKSATKKAGPKKAGTKTLRKQPSKARTAASKQSSKRAAAAAKDLRKVVAKHRPSEKIASSVKSAKATTKPKKSAAEILVVTKKSRNRSSKTKSIINAKAREKNIVTMDQIDYMPSDAEAFMNERQRDYFRRKLIDWKEDILRESRDTLTSLQTENENHPDIADRASSETDRAIELRARDRQRKLIAKIDSALGRLDDGTYGYCEETGEPISLKRLEARPIATLSIEAQERHERRERVYRDD